MQVLREDLAEGVGLGSSSEDWATHYAYVGVPVPFGVTCVWLASGHQRTRTSLRAARF